MRPVRAEGGCAALTFALGIAACGGSAAPVGARPSGGERSEGGEPPGALGGPADALGAMPEGRLDEDDPCRATTAPPPTGTAAGTFLSAEAQLAALGSIALDPGHPPTLQALLGSRGTLATELRDHGREVERVVDAYEVVLAYAEPEWVVAARVRQGVAYQLFAEAIVATPMVIPDDLAASFARARIPAMAVELESRIRAALAPQAEHFRCLAVARFVDALRAARALARADRWSGMAASQLAGLEEAQIIGCIEALRRGEASFGWAPEHCIEPVAPGELDALRGPP